MKNNALGARNAYESYKQIQYYKGRAMAPVNPCGICGGQSGIRTNFFPSTSVFPCQFHSTGATLLGKMKKTHHLSLHFHHTVAQ
jgi:hypothetical protein